MSICSDPSVRLYWSGALLVGDFSFNDPKQLARCGLLFKTSDKYKYMIMSTFGLLVSWLYVAVKHWNGMDNSWFFYSWRPGNSKRLKYICLVIPDEICHSKADIYRTLNRPTCFFFLRNHTVLRYCKLLISVCFTVYSKYGDITQWSHCE